MQLTFYYCRILEACQNAPYSACNLVDGWIKSQLVTPLQNLNVPYLGPNL